MEKCVQRCFSSTWWYAALVRGGVPASLPAYTVTTSFSWYTGILLLVWTAGLHVRCVYTAVPSPASSRRVTGQFNKISSDALDRSQSPPNTCHFDGACLFSAGEVMMNRAAALWQEDKDVRSRAFFNLRRTRARLMCLHLPVNEPQSRLQTVWELLMFGELPSENRSRSTVTQLGTPVFGTHRWKPRSRVCRYRSFLWLISLTYWI